jgi:putative membrane protein
MKGKGAMMKRGMVGAAAIAMVFLLSACGRYGCVPGEGWGRGGGTMMFPGGGMFMGMILFIVFMVAVVWWLTKGGGARDRGTPTRESPLDILKRRYAGGEITKEQFEVMKKDLDG